VSQNEIVTYLRLNQDRWVTLKELREQFNINKSGISKSINKLYKYKVVEIKIVERKYFIKII